MILSSLRELPRTSTNVEAVDCRHYDISPQCHTSPFARHLFDTTTRLWRVEECSEAHDDGAVIVTEIMSSSRRVVRSKLFMLSLPSYCSFIILMMISIALLIQTPRADASLVADNSPSSIINSLSTTMTGPTPITNLPLVLSTNTISATLSSSTKSKGNLLNYLKGQKPISIPENRVITSEDTEDYLEEDSAEFDYTELLKKENASGNELFCVLLGLLTTHDTSDYSNAKNRITNPFRSAGWQSLRVHLW